MSDRGGWGTTRFKAVNTCHPDRRHYAKGLCWYCYRRTPEHLAKTRAYYLANRERWLRYGREQTARRTKQAQIYGVTPEQLHALYAAQHGRCALCGNPPGRKPLAVDHCHKTGHVRAFLCSLCNKGIGCLRDDPDLCARAAEYLRRHTVQPALVPTRSPRPDRKTSLRGARLSSPVGQDRTGGEPSDPGRLDV